MFTFVETPLFSKLIGGYLDDREYAALQRSLARDPELGDVIPGSGGVRKVRWAARGKGKRGGVRVIYYVRSQVGVIWMLTIYAKSEAQDIPTRLLRKIRQEIENA